MLGGERGPHVTSVDVMRATDFVLPAIEIVDRRYSRRGPGPLIVDSVADGAWCGGVVLGSTPRKLNQIDVRGVGGTLMINGQPRAHGVSSAVMGNPVLAVVWLANKLAEFGVAMEEGHIVMQARLPPWCVFRRKIRSRHSSTISATSGFICHPDLRCCTVGNHADAPVQPGFSRRSPIVLPPHRIGRPLAVGEP